MATNPETPISRLLWEAVPLNIPFVTHCVKPAFASSADLVNNTRNVFMNETRETLSYHKLIDPQGQAWKVRSC